jgi:nucleoside-diphosphate-sugar epimerase
MVTGAAGFIGSHLARRLVLDGHRVVGVDNFSDYYARALKQQNLERIPGGDFAFSHCDLNDANLEELLADVDVVFHQAGQPGVRSCWGSHFQPYIDANIRLTQRLLEAATTQDRLVRFVYASSSSVYGDAEIYPTRETDVPQPRSPYGVTKLAAEQLCTLYAKNFSVPTVSLRYFTVFGPSQRPDMAFTRFLTAGARGEPITIYGDGKQIRDFTYVDDIVSANLLAAFGNSPPGAVYNVAGGASTTVDEVLLLVREMSGEQLDVRYEPALAGDVRRTGGDTSSIRKSLGWEPSVTLAEGLQRQWSWIIDSRD